MRSKFSWANWAYLGLLLLHLTGCSEEPHAQQGEVFRYNEASVITSLDPAFARDQGHNWVAMQLFSTLVETDSNLAIRPNLAESWHMDSNGYKWNFTLRSDVWFHADACFAPAAARAFTAEDVVYSLDRLRLPATGSPGAWVLEGVKSVKALDAHHVQILLKAPDPAFLGRLSMPYCSVVAHEAVEKYGAGFSAHPVGTGPFAFKAWARQEKLVLRRNPAYYLKDEKGQSLPYLEAVAIRFIPDRQAAFLEFVKGQLDLVNGVDASYKDQLFHSDGGLKAQWLSQFVLQKSPFLNTEFLGIRAQNPDPAYLGDARVRRALNWALDRVSMMRYLKNNIGIPGYGAILPAGMPGFRTEEEWSQSGQAPWSFRPDSALYLLQKAGVLNAEGKPVEGLAPIVISTTASYRDVCEYVQSAWTAVGLSVEVNVMPSASFREDKAQGRLPLYRASWIADYPDPSNYFMLFASDYAAPNGPNAAQVRSEVFDDYLKNIAKAATESEKEVLLYKAESWLHTTAPMVPLFYDESIRVFRKEWKGIAPHPMNLLDLRRVHKH